MSGFLQYLKDTRQELHHVAWPTRIQTIAYSFLVIGICLFIAFYLAAIDSFLSRALTYLIDHITL